MPLVRSSLYLQLVSINPRSRCVPMSLKFYNGKCRLGGLNRPPGLGRHTPPQVCPCHTGSVTDAR
jgi:hypothetical protein